MYELEEARCEGLGGSCVYTLILGPHAHRPLIDANPVGIWGTTRGAKEGSRAFENISQAAGAVLRGSSAAAWLNARMNMVKA